MTTTTSRTKVSEELQVKGFIAKFEPAHQRLIRAVRAALIERAIARARTPFPERGPRTLIVRSISTKQRPRRRPAAST